jgi:hypothetical protein
MVSILRINVFFRIQSEYLFISPDSIVRRMILLQVARMFLFNYIEKIVVKNVIHPLLPPKIELRTFSVLGRRDNHYTKETMYIKQYISLCCPINKVWRLISDVETHSGKHRAPKWHTQLQIHFQYKSGDIHVLVPIKTPQTTIILDSERERHCNSWKTLALHRGCTCTTQEEH